MGDTVNISATKEGVKFSVKGDIGSGAIVCKQHDGVDDDSEEDVRIRSEEDISLRFALRYLNLFCKATPLSSRVTLKVTSSSVSVSKLFFLSFLLSAMSKQHSVSLSLSLSLN